MEALPRVTKSSAIYVVLEYLQELKRIELQQLDKNFY